MLPVMASVFTCRTCGATVEGFGPFMAHNRAHVAAGEAEARPWRGKRPTAEPAAEPKPKRPRSRAAAGRRRVATTPPAPTPAVERPLPESPEAPPWFVQAVPDHLTPAGEPIEDDTPAEPGRVSREQLRIELDTKLLAEIIRNLSVVVSDWDGAGEAGHFSRIEAGQLAMLLHEPTIDAVDRWFGGNVNRFRLGIAAVVILLGKGRIHARAIAAKRRAAIEAGSVDDATVYARQAAPAVPVAVEPEPPAAEVAATNGHSTYDPIAELAERQRAARHAGQIGGEV